MEFVRNGCRLIEIIEPEECVVLPEDVYIIMEKAFVNCTQTKEIVFSSHIKAIGNWYNQDPPFKNCPKLERVILSEGLEYIGSPTFNDCTGLIEITIPASVTRVESRAFSGCTNLKKVVILGDPKEYKTTAFQKCPAIKEVFIQKKYANVAKNLFKANVALFTLEGKPVNQTPMGETGKRSLNGKNASEQALIDIIEKKVGTAKLTKWAGKMGIETLTVKLKGGKKVAPQAAVLFVIYEYMTQVKKMPAYHKDTYKATICPVTISKEADEIAKVLDRESLLKTLSEKVAPSVDGMYDGCAFTFDIIWGRVPKDKQGWKLKDYNDFIELIEEADYYLKFLNFDRLAPFCRYADEESIKFIISFTERMIKAHGQDGRKLSIIIRSALLLSDTHAAATYLDKYGSLETYAKMRGTTAQALRDTLLSKTDLDANGTMGFDL